MRIIRTLLTVAIAASILASCSASDEDTIIPDQREAIKKFLDTNELAYEEVNGVFRHFGYRESPANGNIARNGKNIGIFFELYGFPYARASSSTNPMAPIPTNSLYSNKPFVQDTLRKIGLNTDYWPQGVFNTTLGSKELMAGLNRGLAGCREGDSVLLFITSNLAFGNVPVPGLDENTAILYIVNLETVGNQ